MAKKKTLTYTVFLEKVMNTDPDAKELGIRQDGVTDWRNADQGVTIFDNCRVYSRDQSFNAHQGAVEPDYEKGWFIQNQGTGQVLMEFRGPCPEPFRTSLLEGTHLMGVVFGRDVSQHN